MVQKERCGRNVAIQCSTVRWIHCGKVRFGIYGEFMCLWCDTVRRVRSYKFNLLYDAIPSGEYLAIRCGKKTQFVKCEISWLQLDAKRYDYYGAIRYSKFSASSVRYSMSNTTRYNTKRHG